MTTVPFEGVRPVNLEWKPDGSVGVVWDDAHESVYTPAYLREQCPCASCKGTHGPPTTLVRQSRGGLPILQHAPKPPEAAIVVKNVLPVGHYAMRFTWGDGHDGGIYSWRHLRSICPCPACKEATP